MKIIDDCLPDIHDREMYGKAWKKMRELGKQIDLKYGEESSIGGVISRATYFYVLLGGLEGRKILDLGCGSVNSRDTGKNRVFEPWLCRLLHASGARVVGVDWAEQVNEEFESYQINLVEDSSLKIFSNSGFDLTCAFSLFDSPSLCRMYSESSCKELFNSISSQLEDYKIVREEGFFVLERGGMPLYRLWQHEREKNAREGR
jgi:hypothetical protein